MEQKERRGIAQLLHDGLQQLLVVAKMRLSFLSANNPSLERGHDLQCVLDITAECSPEIADEHLGLFLFHAVRETLFNTVKHAGVAEANVDIAVTRPGWLRIAISDQGEGCDPETTALDASANHGFGLFSIQERIELHGGRLETLSKPGAGFTTVLEVPFEAISAAVMVQHPDRAPVSRETPSTPQERNGPIRLLLVDDHKLMRDGLSNLFANRPSIVVIGEAADGVEAINKTRKFAPDVVLVDVSMPGMNGVEAAMRITFEFPQIRVVGLSMHEPGDMGAPSSKPVPSRFFPKIAPPNSSSRRYTANSHRASSKMEPLMPFVNGVATLLTIRK